MLITRIRNILISFIAFGLVYAFGFIFPLLVALKDVSPLILSLTFMMQPMLAQLFATALGLEPFPGLVLLNQPIRNNDRFGWHSCICRPHYGC